MAIIHEEYVTTKYSNYGTKASLALMGVYVLIVVIMPYVIPLVTNKLWLDYSTFTERPRTTFTQKAILYVTPKSFASGFKMWTTNQHANSLISSNNFVFPAFSSVASSLSDRVVDLHILNIRYGNTKIDDADLFQFQFKIPRSQTDDFSNVDILLEFGMVLSVYKNIKVSGLTHVHKSIASCSEISVYGDFILKQSYALHGTDQITTYNATLIDFENMVSAQDIFISNILKDSFSRDGKFNICFVLNGSVGGKFVEESSFCRQGPNLGETIEVNLYVKIPVQSYTYEIEWYEKAKYAWIQYMAFLPLFWYGGYLIKRQIVLLGLVNTRLISPTKKLI